MASWAFSTYITDLAEQVGAYASAQASDAAVGPEPARWLISKNNAGPLRADGSPPDIYGGWWLYVGSGTAIGQQRRVIHAIPEHGALAMDQPFSVALSSADVVSLTAPLPMFTRRGVRGLDEIVRMALRDLWFTDRLDIATVASQREYSLSTYAAWLTSEARIERFADGRLAVYDPANAANAPRMPSTIRWRMNWDFSSGPYLVADDLAYDVAGFTFQLDVRRPAGSLVNGVESTTGPSALTDTAGADRTDVTTVALLHAYRWLSGWAELPPEERQRYAGLAEQQEARCRRLAHYEPREAVMTAEAA